MNQPDLKLFNLFSRYRKKQPKEVQRKMRPRKLEPDFLMLRDRGNVVENFYGYK